MLVESPRSSKVFSRFANSAPSSSERFPSRYAAAFAKSPASAALRKPHTHPGGEVLPNGSTGSGGGGAGAGAGAVSGAGSGAGFADFFFLVSVAFFTVDASTCAVATVVPQKRQSTSAQITSNTLSR